VALALLTFSFTRDVVQLETRHRAGVLEPGMIPAGSTAP